ncbi:MAG: hypothetical protein CME71_11820 [Halobacteriovorax sp.]|nr:hypothetical protein [Halobacteriovorax sp.]
MSTSIPTWFITMFDTDVKHAYQRGGSNLRGFTRQKSGVQGDQVRFNKYGTGSLGIKDRHGLVPVMNADHTVVNVTLIDRYGGEYINDLDELKTNLDERQAAAIALAMAAGRQHDDFITDAVLDSLPSGQTTVHGSGGLTKAKVQTTFENFNSGNIPNDGQRVWLIAPSQWTDLLDISEFANQDFIGPDSLPWVTGVTAKRWLGFFFMLYTNLPTGGSNSSRQTIAWHTPAMGSAAAVDMMTNFDWVPERGEYFSQIRLSANAVRIDDAGVFEVECTE